MFGVEATADLLPSSARPALPVATRLLRVPSAARVAAPLEPIYLRAVTVTLPKAKVEG